MAFDPAEVKAPDWRLRLQTLIDQRMLMPFAWGLHDCCLWAADAVLAQTGVDPAAAERGTYADAAGAARLVRDLGGLEAIAGRAGPAIPPLMATLGDIGLVTLEDREALAVCAGQVWLAPGSSAMAAIPLQKANRAWRVARG